MKKRLRLTTAMVALCGIIPICAAHAALDEETVNTSSGARETPRQTEQIHPVTFDTYGHIDVPRDSNGHILIKTTLGRHGRSSDTAPHGGQICGTAQVKPQLKETAEAMANVR